MKAQGNYSQPTGNSDRVSTLNFSSPFHNIVFFNIYAVLASFPYISFFYCLFNNCLFYLFISFGCETNRLISYDRDFKSYHEV